jgi:hypothetical protein
MGYPASCTVSARGSQVVPTLGAMDGGQAELAPGLERPHLEDRGQGQHLEVARAASPPGGIRAETTSAWARRAHASWPRSPW